MNFKKWLLNHGLNEEGLLIYESNILNMGKGLIAKKNIDRSINGKIILSISEKIIISPKKSFFEIDFCFCLKNLNWKNWINFDGLKSIILFLFHEKIKSNKSFFSPYFNEIPSFFNNFLYFNQKEIELLPKNIKNKALNCVDTFLKMFESVKPFLEQISIFHKFNGVLLDEFKWSYSAVNSRCVYCCFDDNSPFIINQNVLVVPYFDFFNHKAGARAEAKFDRSRNLFNLSIFQDYKIGQQIFIDYGPHTNEDLLIDYGFVVSDNYNELIDIFDTLKQLYDLNINKSIDLLIKINIISKDFDPLQCFHISFDGFSYCSLLLIEIINKYQLKINFKCSDILQWNEEELRVKNQLIKNHIKDHKMKQLLDGLASLRSNGELSDNLRLIEAYFNVRLSILNKL